MDQSISYKTTIKSYKRLIFDDHSEQFKIFINFCCKNSEQENEVNTQYQFDTTINKARVISSKINQIYQIDPTIAEYSIYIPNKIKTTIQDITELIKQLFKSLESDIYIKEDQRTLFLLLCFKLGSECVNEFELSSEEESLSYLTTNIHSKSIEYLSNHFKEFISNGHWKNISNEILKEIIDKYIARKTKLNKEVENDEIEDIFKMLKSQEEEEESDIVLYFLLNIFEYEYNDDMYKYIFSHLDDDLIKDNISHIIFIIRKFFIGIHQTNINKSNKKKIGDILYNVNKIEYEGNELSGIVSYLHSNNNTIEVQSGIKNNSNPISNILKYDSGHINESYYNWRSNNPKSSDSWILFDFGDQRKIKLSSYTIRSNCGDAFNNAHPKTWSILGSNDCNNWDLINKQENNSELNRPYKQHRFECDNNNTTSKYYRYIRYEQKDTWDNDRKYQYGIHLTCFEFFGSILTKA